MGETKIEWATHTWNPTRGCSRISPGCQNCYAEKIAARFSGDIRDDDGGPGSRVHDDPSQPFRGFAIMGASGPRWTGKVELIEDKLLEPLRWRKPRRVFVNSMSDPFHEALPFEQIDRVFAVAALCPDQTFMILTKRAERMFEYFTTERPLTSVEVDVNATSAHIGNIVWDSRGNKPANYYGVAGGVSRIDLSRRRAWPGWPLPNVWLGVSAENQKYADERIPWLLKTPAAVRFVSYEPALGPLNATPFLRRMLRAASDMSAAALESGAAMEFTNGIDWVIAGGESGPHARPAHPDWFRSVRDQCAAAGVAFFFKQWGEWALGAEHGFLGHPRAKEHIWSHGDGTGTLMLRVGKKAAGRLLDGREYNELPQQHQHQGESHARENS